MKSVRSFRKWSWNIILILIGVGISPAVSGQINPLGQLDMSTAQDTASTNAVSPDTAGQFINLGGDSVTRQIEQIQEKYSGLLEREEIAFSVETFLLVWGDVRNLFTGAGSPVRFFSQTVSRYFSSWAHIFTLAIGIALLIGLTLIYSPLNQWLSAVRGTAYHSEILAANTAGYFLEILLRSLPTLFVMTGIWILTLVLELPGEVNRLVLRIVLFIVGYKLLRWLLEVLFAPEEVRDRVAHADTGVARYFFHIGRSLLQWTLLYILIHLGLQFINYRPEFISFVEFLYRIGAIVLFAALFARRDFTLALFPSPDRPVFRNLLRFFSRIYYLLYAVLIFTGILSIIGYSNLSGFIFSRTAITIAVLLIGILLNQILYDAIDWIIPEERRKAKDEEGEQRAKFWDRVHTLSQFGISVLILLFGVVILLKAFWVLAGQSVPGAILGLMTLTLFQIQGTPISPWSIMKAILVILLFIYISRYLRRFLKSRVLEKTTLDIGARHAILTITHYVILIVAILIALETVGIQLTTLKIFAGALGLGIGFGLQNIANNFVSGLIILFERPVKNKDFVEVGDILGTITRISARSTTIVTRDNIAIIVPNSDFIEKTVVNWSLNDTPTRVHVPIGVKYGSDVEKVREILMDIAKEHPRILRYPQPRVWFEEFAESSLNFDLLIWINDPQEGINNIRSDVNFEINRRFQEAGIGIPFPQQDVHIKVDKEDVGIIRELLAKNSGSEEGNQNTGDREESG